MNEQTRLILESNRAIMLALHQGLENTLDEESEVELVRCALEIEEFLNPKQKEVEEVF